MKQARYKVETSAKHTFKELQDRMIDIQLVLNNLALSHCEDDIQLPVLTPNMIIFGKVSYLIELLPEDIEEKTCGRGRSTRKVKMRCANDRNGST